PATRVELAIADLQGRCATGGASPAYPRPDSNRHRTAPHTVASTVGLRGLKPRAEDSNLHRRAPEARVLPVRPAPIGWRRAAVPAGRQRRAIAVNAAHVGAAGLTCST